MTPHFRFCHEGQGKLVLSQRTHFGADCTLWCQVPFAEHMEEVTVSQLGSFKCVALKRVAGRINSSNRAVMRMLGSGINLWHAPVPKGHAQDCRSCKMPLHHYCDPAILSATASFWLQEETCTGLIL